MMMMMMGDQDAIGLTSPIPREDFTLLNLSKSSSTPSSSDELFAHHQHPLPPNNHHKKKKLRLKRRGGYSIRPNRSSDDSSQPSHGMGSTFGFGGSNVIYGLLILLFSWSATLSWLMFSLRNELAASNEGLSAHEVLTKELPMELAKMNQTVQALESNISALAAKLSNLEIQLGLVAKNVTETNGLAHDVQRNLGQLGSKENELSAKVEELIKASHKDTPKGADDKAKTLQSKDTTKQDS